MILNLRRYDSIRANLCLAARTDICIYYREYTTLFEQIFASLAARTDIGIYYLLREARSTGIGIYVTRNTVRVGIGI